MGVKTLLERQRANVDPLGSENILGFVTGPLTGSGAPMGGRYMIVAKSPLTGSLAGSNSGGTWGPKLKRRCLPQRALFGYIRKHGH